MRKIENIPPEIAVKLDACLGRVRRILFLRGFCSALAVFGASILAIMAVDAMVTVYAAWIRWLLWSSAVGATVCAVRHAIVKPLSRRFSAADVASLVERNHPELEERLSSVVELARAGAASASPGLTARMTEAAIEDAAAVSPRKEFTARSVKPRLIAAAVPAGIFAFLFAAFPEVASRLAVRALVPTAELDNIYASSLDVSPGDAVVLEGSSFAVDLTVAGGFPSHAFVRTRFDGKSETVERMSRVGEETGGGSVFYSFVYPRVGKSFTYRVSCGKALTRGYRVTVVPEPTYVDRRITLVYPAYTGRGAQTYTNTPEIVALAGSKAVVSARIARPGLEGEIRLSGGRIPGEVDEKGNIGFSFGIDGDSAGTWRSVLWDENGFTNVVDESSVTVERDAPPEVALVSPSPETTDLKLPRTASLPIAFSAKDDFGISRAVIEVDAGTGGWKDAQEVPTVKSDSGYDGSHTVHFLDGAYRTAHVLRFRVRVEDNLPPELGGPGIAHTPEITVEIARDKNEDETLEKQELDERVKEKKKEMTDLFAQLRSAKWYFNDASVRYGRAGENKALRKQAVDRSMWAKNRVAKAEELLAKLIEDIGSGELAEIEDTLKSILADNVVPIRKAAEDVLFASDDAVAVAASQKLAKDTGTAIKRLEEAWRQFHKIVKKVERIRQARDLVRRMETLKELEKKNRIDRKRLAEENKKIEKKLKDKELRKLVEEEKKRRERSVKDAKKRKENEADIPRPEKSDVDENWFKLKGKSASGADADALDDVPAEYRSLVRDYFKALNEGGGK